MSHRTSSRLCHDENGAVAVIAGAAIAAAVGLAAFTVDLSNAYSVQSRLQNAADAAALAAAQKLGTSEEEALALALEFAQKNVSSTDGAVTSKADVVFGQYDLATRTFMPGAQPYNAVRVWTRRTSSSGNAVNTYFGGIFGVDSIDVDAEAVAVLTRPVACVYALQAFGTNTFEATGSGAVRVPNCGIQVDSPEEPAMATGGAASIAGKRICAPGGYAGRKITPTPETECALDPDPLAGLPEPPRPSNCDRENETISNPMVLLPGKYCGEIRITSGAQVTLSPGTYYFEAANFVVDGSASMEGDEVLLFFDKDSEFSLTASNLLRLTAPTTGKWRGISIFQSRQGSTTRSGTITGDRELHIGGTIYTPKLDLYMTGNSSLHTTMEVGYVIANTFAFNGSSEAILDMHGSAIPTAFAGSVSLVK
ncbi:MAG TPA: TadG family pilus assembly protein [Afifellaceae bacterium]|nr:TadG family pilus assembly protein [Afifellaceae bacterium]